MTNSHGLSRQACSSPNRADRRSTTNRKTYLVPDVSTSSRALPPELPNADIWFYWDPVCPFAWITSRWLKKVEAQKDYTIDWRFISLWQLNSHIDYDTHFPPEYEAGHTAGLRMLRMAAAIRQDEGREAMGDLYTALGQTVFDVAPADDRTAQRSAHGTSDHVVPLLADLGLSSDYADALTDESFDPVVQAETDEALSKTGKDVGTPIIAHNPPDGLAFFGPVISRVPSDEDAVPLWDSVITLAGFSGFAELKRSLRERPQLKVFGVEETGVGVEEDWHGGSRRQKK